MIAVPRKVQANILRIVKFIINNPLRVRDKGLDFRNRIGSQRILLHLSGIANLVTRNIRNLHLVIRTGSLQRFILSWAFHAAAGLVTDYNQVFERNTTQSRHIPLIVLDLCNQFTIQPKAHVTIAPLACNQVPVIALKFSLAISIEVLVMMVFLEIKVSILVEEMDSSAIVTKKRSRILVKEVLIRTEPEFDRSNTQRINQIHAERSYLTFFQLESFTANTFDLFPLVKKWFQFIKVTCVFIHFKSGSIATNTRAWRNANSRDSPLLWKGIEVSCDATSCINSSPNLLAIIFQIGSIRLNRKRFWRIRFRTASNQGTHGYQGTRNPFDHFVTHDNSCKKEQECLHKWRYQIIHLLAFFSYTKVCIFSFTKAFLIHYDTISQLMIHTWYDCPAKTFVLPPLNTV